MTRFVPAALLVAAALFLLPTSAFAGRLVVTGHDAELHCTDGDGQCHWFRVAVDFARGGAPNPNAPVLLLDYDPNGQNQPTMLANAMNMAYNNAPPPFKVVEPRTPAFQAEPINTAAYSAVVVASDYTCGGCDLNADPTGNGDMNFTPDSDAINARKADFATFFNSGGGILALAGASHGDGDTTDGQDDYYSFVPIPLGGLSVSPPFKLTPAGAAVGFQDDPNGNNDINCCATHNSFNIPPAGSPLQVFETDSANRAETLGATGGQITDGTIVGKPVEGKTANAAVDKGKVFVKLPPGTHAKGKYAWAAKKKSNGFTQLKGLRSIPLGSTLDTRKGQVKLTLAASLTRTQTGHFGRGLFVVRQPKKNPLTTLSLTGGGLKACNTKVPKGGSPKVVAARRRHHRSLFSHVKGHFRTRGRSSSATVRGTMWVEKDSCTGTLTTVKQGTVVVRDFAKHKKVVVHKGHSYFARALRRAQHK